MPGAGRAEIRRAYRHRAREVHPDATGTDTTDAMARLNRARDEALARAGVGTRRTSASESAPRPGGDAAGATGAVDDEDAFDHAVDWNDYWSAWNDPPKRWRTRETG
jgi:hypothetical protein